jgi:hypothetical protein
MYPRKDSLSVVGVAFIGPKDCVWWGSDSARGRERLRDREQREKERQRDSRQREKEGDRERKRETEREPHLSCFLISFDLNFYCLGGGVLQWGRITLSC